MLLLMLGYSSLLLAQPEPRLHGRSTLAGPRVVPTEAQLRWLWQHREITLAVVRPDNPPLDILGIGHDYEGISADYAGLIAQHLQVGVRVRLYASLNEAVSALRTGQAHLLGSVTSAQAEDAGLRLSAAYAQDRPVLVGRADQDPVRTDAPLRLAMREGYWRLDSILALYPQAQVEVYPSTRAALAGLAFGQADLYLGGALESQYQIGKGQMSQMEVVDRPSPEEQDMGFASAALNQPLLELVDAVLSSIPAAEHARIRRRWGGQGLIERHPLQLSDSERQWLQDNPKVRVLVNAHYPPISYRDGEGRLRGLAIDVLQRIGRRSGIEFELHDGEYLEHMVDQLRQGKADLIAGVTPSESRESFMTFSRAFASSERVLVTVDSASAPTDLAQLSGQRLAMSRSGYPREFLVGHYPEIRQVAARGPVDAVWRVASGRADAALVPLIGARAIVERMSPNQLKVSASLPMEPAYFAFASHRGALELQSILNKALLSLSPQEMEALDRRWHSEVIIADSFWQRYRVQVLQGFAGVVLALLLALVWVRYLRRLIQVRAQAERALADQLEFMRVMIDGTPHPIYVCDKDGRVLTCNSSYLLALDLQRDQVLGQVLGQAPGMGWQAGWRHVLETGQALVEDRHVQLPDARQLTLYHWMLPYRSEGKAGVIGGWIDVSERQRLHAELLDAKHEADSANQAKTRFLATMSHEIRTPLNAVLGMLELALRKAEQGVLDRLSIEVASEAARGLLELIGDILDVTRIESGHLELAAQPLRLLEHVQRVVQVFQQQARSKGLQLLLETEGDVDVEVLLDPLRFKQVLANLLSNAIKFTHKGSVRLALSGARHGDRLALRITVEDTGIGIPEADLAQQGALFWQASNHRQSARRGAGLGLSISRTLCELMGGSMRLRSTLGVGTCIDIELMADTVARTAIAQAEDEDQVLSASTVSLRVLVVDDYSASRLLLANQLGYLGHRASLAEDGAQALRLWIRQDFDVVITDCNMPVLDGHALAQAIRLHERRTGRPACRLFGLTANALEDERRRCRQSGMDACLFKPLGLKALGQVLAGEAVAGGEGNALEHEQGYDLSSLQRLTDGDLAAFDALLADLLDSNRQDYAQLRACAEHDLVTLGNLAHRIKGGARIIKARHLIEACEQVEHCCAQGALPTAQVQAVCRAMRELEQVLEQHAGRPCEDDA